MIYPRRDLNKVITVNERSVSGYRLTTIDNSSNCVDLNIIDINESQAGICVFATGDTCVAESIHSVDYYNVDGVTLLWEIVSGAVTITNDQNGQIDNEGMVVAVQSVGDVDVDFELKVTITDGAGIIQTKTESFIHTKSLV